MQVLRCEYVVMRFIFCVYTLAAFEVVGPLCVLVRVECIDPKYLGTEILERIQTNNNRMCTRRPLQRHIMSDRSTKLCAKRQV